MKHEECVEEEEEDDVGGGAGEGDVDWRILFQEISIARGVESYEQRKRRHELQRGSKSRCDGGE